MQYFFAGEIISAEEDYLLIEVNDPGNSNLPDGCTVEVATMVTDSDECPNFSVGEYAKVLMAQSIKDDPPGRLEALAIENDKTESFTGLTSRFFIVSLYRAMSPEQLTPPSRSIQFLKRAKSTLNQCRR